MNIKLKLYMYFTFPCYIYIVYVKSLVVEVPKKQNFHIFHLRTVKKTFYIYQKKKKKPSTINPAATKLDSSSPKISIDEWQMLILELTS